MRDLHSTMAAILLSTLLLSSSAAAQVPSTSSTTLVYTPDTLASAIIRSITLPVCGDTPLQVIQSLLFSNTVMVTSVPGTALLSLDASDNMLTITIRIFLEEPYQGILSVSNGKITIQIDIPQPTTLYVVKIQINGLTITPEVYELASLTRNSNIKIVAMYAKVNGELDASVVTDCSTGSVTLFLYTPRELTVTKIDFFVIIRDDVGWFNYYRVFTYMLPEPLYVPEDSTIIALLKYTFTRGG